MIKLSNSINEYLSSWRKCDMCYDMIKHIKILTVATEPYHEVCPECYKDNKDYINELQR